MELTTDQKLSIILSVKARIRYLEGMDQEDSYVIQELCTSKELLEMLDHTMTIELDFYSDYEVAA
jgi:capsule polysaccharide export protein KpsE/RkpR